MVDKVGQCNLYPPNLSGLDKNCEGATRFNLRLAEPNPLDRDCWVILGARSEALDIIKDGSSLSQQGRAHHPLSDIILSRNRFPLHFRFHLRFLLQFHFRSGAF